MPRDADHVAQVEQLEQLVGLSAHVVQFHVDLQLLSRRKNVREARFSMNAQGENPASYTDGRLGGFERGRVGLPVLLKKLGRRSRRVEFMGIRVVPARFDLGKLFLTLKKLIDWFKR